MAKRHTFRFLDGELNRRLIALLEKKAKGKYTFDEDGDVHYSYDDEDLIGNELICAVRAKMFPEWQVLACPDHWAASYEQYMIEHKIPFTQEVRDNSLRFLIPRSYRPHSWRLKDDSSRTPLLENGNHQSSDDVSRNPAKVS